MPVFPSSAVASARFLLVLPFAALLVSTSSACSSSKGGPVADSGPPPAASVPANLTWCPGAAVPAGCTALAICGVCVPGQSSPKDLVRTSDTKEYAGSGAVDLGCLEKGATITPLDSAASKKVTMRGYAKIFANGPDSMNVRIEVFKEGANGALGEKVGETITDKTLPAGVKTETIYKAGKPQERTLYPYEIKDAIPTETPLIVKTSGKDPSDGWNGLYDYGAVALNSKLTSGVWVFDVRALGNDDYVSILKAAYARLPDGGKGAIAGEVHDCGDVRLSNATVETSPKSPLGLFYLSEEEDDPLPDPSRRATGKLGLYAAGAYSVGTYSVAAAGYLKGEAKALGSYDLQVFPDSVSLITFRGLRPWQKK